MLVIIGLVVAELGLLIKVELIMQLEEQELLL